LSGSGKYHLSLSIRNQVNHLFSVSSMRFLIASFVD
jgi:hypothetical protein